MEQVKVNDDGLFCHLNRNDRLVQDVEMYLPKLIQICFLSCGRSIAHKCSRLLIMCGRYDLNFTV